MSLAADVILLAALIMLRVELSTPCRPVFFNRVIDLMSAVDDSGVTTSEFSSDWAADEILRAETGCIWFDAGANIDAMLYVMKSADCAAGETVCELT